MGRQKQDPYEGDHALPDCGGFLFVVCGWAQTLARSNPQAIGLSGWVFMIVQVAGLVLSWKYFSAGPAMLSAIVAVCLGWAAWLVMGKG